MSSNVSSRNKIKWYNTSNPGQQQLGGSTTPAKKSGFIPTNAQIRKMMHEDSEGGRAICYFCHTGFTMKYMRSVKITMFQTEFACKDCIQEHHLDTVH